jgi:serine/threonine-protein kinase
LVLPRTGALGPDDVLVPAGPFRCGSADAVNALRPGTRWVDAFVIQRFPVRLSEFLRFLDALVADGREDLAVRYAPSHRAGVGVARGAMLVARAPDGTFRLGVDDDGDEWQPDWPVMHVTFEAANAYAAWWSAQTGDPWRLPDELEWEKAARGTDGRPYPWGVAMDATWANVRNSRPGPAGLAKVTDFPDDASPYGVRGLGGNVKDWTTSKFDRTELAGALVPDASHRVTRGGYWFGGTSLVAPRAWSHEGSQTSDIGFRLVRPWP